MIRKINKIIVHCTATPEGREVSVKEITAWHKARGFSDIGYHYIVALDGKIYEGRPVQLSGAHCLGHNANSIGVVYVGGMDKNMKKAKDTRTPEQKDGLARLLKSLVLIHPEAQIYGHRDFEKNKECPSFDARTEYKSI